MNLNTIKKAAIEQGYFAYIRDEVLFFGILDKKYDDGMQVLKTCYRVHLEGETIVFDDYPKGQVCVDKYFTKPLELFEYIKKQYG